MKPYSESCEQNKAVILTIIKPLLTEQTSLLEIGSGTGQHAVYFADAMPHIHWHTSDRQVSLAGINQWLADARAKKMNVSNVQPPLLLDVMQENWPELSVDAVFSANTLHIMSAHEVERLFKQAAKLLQKGGVFLVYGPFNYQGQYTSESNRQFDVWLKSRNPDSCIKDFSFIDDLAQNNGLQLQTDYEMPANNRILFWQKI